MQALELKICDILAEKAIFIWACCIKRMRPAKSEHNFGRLAEF